VPGVTITPAHIGLLMAFLSVASVISVGAVAYSTVKRLEKNDENKERRITGIERWAISHGYKPED